MDYGLWTRDQKRGISILLILWLMGWVGRPYIQDFLKSQVPGPKSLVLLGPLTAPEKILLGFTLDIRSLTEKDWVALPGIGPSTAKKIIAYQTDHGSFLSLDSLMDVKGIGPRTVESLRQFFDTPKP